MSARPKSPSDLEPLLLQAVGEPAGAFDVRSAIAEVLAATEREVAQITAEARLTGERLTAEVAAECAAVREVRLSELRRLKGELIDRASQLAHGFEDLLDALDLAEAGLLATDSAATPAAKPVSPAVEAVREVVRHRQPIAFAGIEPPATPPEAETWPAVPAAETPRRPWWRRWWGEAA